MKVAELEGAALDYWVARAEKIESAWIANEEGEKPVCVLGPVKMDRFEWSPSTAWEQSGPIIERERITVQASQAGDWRAFLGDGTTNAGTGRSHREPMIQTRGDSPLIAAMRAFVASKFGDEVPEAA